MRAKPDETGKFRSWEPENLLADRYRVMLCIRQSGTCQLYRVQDVFRDSNRLLMRPSPRLLARPGGREWFEEYGRSILSVPHHVNVLTCERMSYEGNLPFLLMADLAGRGWDTAIADESLRDLTVMLDVARQVAVGLAWLHANGRVHYNVKPANVLIADSGGVKIWKYGESEAKTRAFASPEQIAGRHPLTHATDVWSWAVSVLTMFVGRTAWPSGAKAPRAFRRYLQTGPAVLGIPRMPGSLAQLLATCLKKEPSDRTGSMDDIADTLAQLSGTADTAAPAELDDSVELDAELPETDLDDGFSDNWDEALVDDVVADLPEGLFDEGPSDRESEPGESETPDRRSRFSGPRSDKPSRGRRSPDRP